MRKLLIACGTVLAALALAACGGDDGPSKSEEFAEDYKPLNAKLLATGKKLNSALQSANEKTNAQLATQFNTLSRDTGDIGEQIAELDPPEESKDDVEDLTESIATVSATLEKISDAAGANDPKAANTETKRLLTQSLVLNTAQNKVAAATGADKGSS
jgi:hypothetical protein